ncbi:MAG: transporter substrate-binding domain-containing protein, partial [Actinomycetota bacterium]
MNRTRILIAALVAVFALVVASCADEDGGQTGATGPTPATGATGATATGATGETGFPAFTTLEDGVLQAANCLDYPPFESVVDGDEVGFDIDLVEEIAARLGLTVEWIRADFDTVFTAVAGDQLDIVAAAATLTAEREQVG